MQPLNVHFSTMCQPLISAGSVICPRAYLSLLFTFPPPKLLLMKHLGSPHIAMNVLNASGGRRKEL